LIFLTYFQMANAGFLGHLSVTWPRQMAKFPHVAICFLGSDINHLSTDGLGGQNLSTRAREVLAI
jgi:hypothetical protein